LVDALRYSVEPRLPPKVCKSKFKTQEPHNLGREARKACERVGRLASISSRVPLTSRIFFTRRFNLYLVKYQGKDSTCQKPQYHGGIVQRVRKFRIYLTKIVRCKTRCPDATTVSIPGRFIVPCQTGGLPPLAYWCRCARACQPGRYQRYAGTPFRLMGPLRWACRWRRSGWKHSPNQSACFPAGP
jgi:hypothetical protein